MASLDHAPRKASVLNALIAFMLLVALACAAFTVAASLVLALGFGAGVVPGAWLRVVLFFPLLCASAGGLWWLLYAERGMDQRATQHGTIGPPHGREYAVLIGAVLLSLLLTLPHLADWPRAEPDETHHLIVAKNIVEHGRYASGNPVAGFKDFDGFDSIGPVGMGLAAAAMQGFGTGIVPVRAMAALCLASLIGLLYLLYRPLMGAAAAWAVWVVPLTFSTVYLGRSFYGEVPAMMFFLGGLLCWRHGILRGRLHVALAAGIFFGLAVLVKAIVLLSAFAFAAVWFHDCLTRRQIRLLNVVLTGIGALLPLLLWAFLQSRMAHSAGAAAEGTIALYQHYLLFGVEPILGNLARSVAAYPWAHAGFAAAVLVALPRILGAGGDPALRVLVIYAAFNAWWWLCFTPGQLPRYLWFSYSACAPLLGWLAVQSALYARGASSLPRRIMAAALFAGLILPPLAWGWGQAREVYTNDEMADVRALAAFVDTFPETARIATTHFPLEGNLSFLVDRYPARGEDPAVLWRSSDVVITLGPEAPALPGASARPFGVYWALYRQPETPE